MQNLQSDADLKVSENEAILQNFQVEELEERLENKWLSGGGGSTLTSCTITQEVNMCKGTITPLTSILVSNGSCPQPVSVYVCKF